MEKTNILIVDDRPDNLITLEGALRELGLNCIKAYSGEEALSLALDHDLALILLDVQMPEMDGFDTARLFKGARRTKDVPIIMVTAINKDLKHVLEGYEAGAVDYLFKPVNASVLESKVRVFIELYRQQRIIQAQAAELARSNKELDDFAYVASHDLKAPLRAIDHLAQWIAEDAADVLPEPSREHLSRMQQRVERMESLLDDLLEYSRAGRIAGALEEVDLGHLLSDVVDLLAPPPGFAIVVSPDMPRLSAHRVPLEQVLRNLIGNSIKHHHRPDGRIEVSARDTGDFVEFSVADDGPGVAPEFHERIFQMFQTLEPRDKTEGSGIGLAIVKKIIESEGGTIKVDSSPGAGTTFRFTWLKAASRDPVPA